MTKKSEEEIIFPEVKVNDIVVKPWTFGKLFDISIPLEKALVKCDEAGEDILAVMSTLNVVKIAKLFNIAKDELLQVIAITIEKDEEEIKKLDVGTGIRIAMTIFGQNRDLIKNALSPQDQ